MTSEPNEYAVKVAEAEAAVKSVKDPELRRVAFEKVLEHLLEGERESDVKPAPAKTAHGSKATKKGRGKTRETNKRKGPKGRLVELVEEGYFQKQRTIADVKAELANRGYHIPLTSMSGPLQSLTREKRLRRQKAATKGKGAKATYAYSNW